MLEGDPHDDEAQHQRHDRPRDTLDANRSAPLLGRQSRALLPVRLPLVVLRVLALRRHVLLRRLWPPWLTPWLPARRSGLVDRSARYPGLAATCGQHDTFVRGPYSRGLLLVTLSALRHRDSYV